MGDKIDFCADLIYMKFSEKIFHFFLKIIIGCGMYRKITQTILGRFYSAEKLSGTDSLRFSSNPLLHLPGERDMRFKNIK